MFCISGVAAATSRCHGGVGDPASVAPDLLPKPPFQGVRLPSWLDGAILSPKALQTAHMGVICPLHKQQEENVACFLHHFSLVSFLCYFVLFPHRTNLNNFPSHIEVKSF